MRNIREKGISFMKKRSLILLSISFFLLLGVLFHKPIICYALKVKLQKKIPLQSEISVNYQKICFNPNSISFRGLEVFDQLSQKKILSVEESFIIGDRQIFYKGPKVKIQGASLYFEKELLKRDKTSKTLYETLSRVLVSLKITILDSKFFIRTHQGEKLAAFFDYTRSKEKGSFGKLRCYFDIKEKENPPLEVCFFTSHGEVLTKFKMKNLSLRLSSSLLGCFSEHIKAFNVSQGHVDGELQLGLAKGDLVQYFRSDLVVKNLFANLSNSKDFIALDLVKLNAFLPLDVQEKPLLKTVLSPLIFKEMAVSSDIINGRFSIKNPVTNSVWEVKNFLGRMHINLELSPAISFSGDMVKDQVEYPFDLMAKGIIKSEKNWWLELDLAIGENTNRNHTNIYLTFLESSTLYAKAFLNQLKAEQLKMFQDVLMVKLPQVGTLCLEEALVSTELSVTANASRIQSLEFDNLKIDNLKASFLGKEQAKLESSHIEGQMHIHIPFFENWEKLLSTVSFQDLNYSQVIGDKTYRISNAQGQLVLDNGFFDCQNIEGVFEGIKTKIALKGPLQELVVDFTGEFANHHLFSSFENKIHSKHKELLPLSKIRAELFCDFSSKFAARGEISFGFSDKKVEKIQLNLDFPGRLFGEDIDKKQFLSNLSGEFSSDKISENSYLWLLGAFNQRWYTVGDLAVFGKFNHQGLKFTLQSTEDVFYDSEDISLWVHSTKNMSSIGCFEFDSKNCVWDIDIPLKRAKVLDKKYRLFFDKVIADVHIHQTKLHAKNISAFSDGIYFQGNLDLDFTHEDWLKLNLFPKYIEGKVGAFQTFLRHFPSFQNLEIPLEGLVKSCHENEIKIGYNDETSDVKALYSFAIERGVLLLPEGGSITDIEGELGFNSEKNFLELKDLTGDINLSKSNQDKKYKIKFHKLICQTEEVLKWSFDMRLESLTYDVLRFVGGVKSNEFGYEFTLDKSLSHCFQSKFKEFDMGLDRDFNFSHVSIQTKLQLSDSLFQISMLQKLGVVSEKLYEIASVAIEDVNGELDLNVNYNRSHQQMNLEGHCQKLQFGDQVFDQLDFQLIQEKNKVILNHCKCDKFSLFAVAEKDINEWSIPLFECDFGKVNLKLSDGKFDFSNARFISKIKDFYVPLEAFNLKDVLFPTKKDVAGAFNFIGSLELTLPTTSQKDFAILKLQSESNLQYGKDPFKVFTPTPFEVSFQTVSKAKISNLQIDLHHSKNDLLKSSYEIARMSFDLKQRKIEGSKVSVLVPPEMVLRIAEEVSIQGVSVNSEGLEINKFQIPWDNQLQTVFDFSYGMEGFKIQGILQEGYYWVEKEVVFIKDCYYQYGDSKLTTTFRVDYLDFKLEIFSRLDLKESPNLFVSFKDTQEDTAYEKKSLDIQCKYSADDGFYIQTVDGSIYGIEATFHRNPRSFLPHIMILSGNLKIDTSGLVKAFPEMFYQTFKDLGMGSGYEISGDLMISKKEFKSSYFKGYLKGRDFEFLGFQFKTLLSELYVNLKQVHVRDFSLSDQSGVMHVKELKLSKSIEDGSWNLSIPELLVQDFRPSFLKKGYADQDMVKPFVIKDLRFFNIEGDLGYKDSFTGFGFMEFVNTFKRDYNLLDIPIEIIGRIGFDLGLFVPVKGNVEFEMKEGKILLKDLKNSYSDGKRSKFYLSSYKDSYIGLDGSIFVDIKMKQYVLLKITQPFTLSIRGLLSKPKYSLK